MVISSYRMDITDEHDFYGRLRQEIEQCLAGKLRLGGERVTIVHFCTDQAEAGTGKWTLLHHLGGRALLRELTLTEADGDNYEHLFHVILRQLSQWTEGERRQITWIDVHYANSEQGITARMVMADIFESLLYYAVPQQANQLELDLGEYEPEWYDLDEDEMEDLRDELGVTDGYIGVAYLDEEQMTELEEQLENWIEQSRESFLEVLLAVDLNFKYIQYWRGLARYLRPFKALKR